MFGIPISDLLTYTNLAYLLSLLLTFLLTATLWRVSVLSQQESELQLEEYKLDAAARIAEANSKAKQADERAAQANAIAEIARRDASVALAAASVADQKGAEAKLAAAAADERAAKATERAASAELQATQANRGVSTITTPRSLEPAQSHSISVALKKFAGTTFTVAISEGFPDGFALATQIIDALSQSGWIAQDWPGRGPTFVLSGSHRIGTVVAIGVVIVYFPDQTSKYFQAAKDLAKSLTLSGIAATAQASIPPQGTSQDALEIAIGIKPL